MDGSSQYQVALIIALGTVAMLLLSVAIVIFMVFYQKRMIQEQLKLQQLELSYQQKMMEAALESQENERRRVAGDLHDSIGGMLSTIRVGLTTLARQIPDPERIEQPKKMLDDTIASVRQLSRDLMPSTLEKFGLAQAVRELCDRFQAASLIPTQYVEEGDVKPFDVKKELMVYRIVQELINNAVKHAQASTITVTLRAGATLAVTVEDDGIGFDAEHLRHTAHPGKGLGLFNIENRARLLDARLDFDPHTKRGSKVTLVIPNENLV